MSGRSDSAKGRPPLPQLLMAGAGATSLLAALALAGCTDTGTTAAATLTPTSISVDPSAFLGPVPCSKMPGGLQTYVATLTDMGPPDADAYAPFTLPSSPPTACSLAA